MTEPPGAMAEDKTKLTPEQALLRIIDILRQLTGDECKRVLGAVTRFFNHD